MIRSAKRIATPAVVSGFAKDARVRAKMIARIAKAAGGAVSAMQLVLLPIQWSAFPVGMLAK
jgi:predicted anti-sigma-YlaC factor YlaD